jgi:hypothetical protein
VLLALLLAATVDLTPPERDALIEERRLLVDERPSLAAPIAITAVGVVGELGALATLLALGSMELTWSFNGFGRSQRLVDDMLRVAAIAGGLGVSLAATGIVLMVFRINDRAKGSSRVEEIDHELRTRSDYVPR